MSSRVDISDTLMYVYEMLGAELLSNLYDKLGRLLTNAEQPTSWQVGETQTDKHEENYFLLLCCMDASAVKCVILDLINPFFHWRCFVFSVFHIFILMLIHTFKIKMKSNQKKSGIM